MQVNTAKWFQFKRIAPRASWREIVAILMIFLAIRFFKSERKELLTIIPQLSQSNPRWLISLLAVAIVTILCQAGIYVFSFRSIGTTFKITPAIDLFLKRNFLSIFLPAGGVSALAYLPRNMKRAGYNKILVHQASALFALTGLLSLIAVAIPVLLFTLFSEKQIGNAWLALPVLFAMIILGWGILRSFQKQGLVFSFLNKRFSTSVSQIKELTQIRFSKKKYLAAFFSSMGVELCGILTLYFSIRAIGATPSIEIAAITYVVSVLMMVISPFLRGLGAVELSMVLVLQQFGFDATQALSITLLYRIFEFWLPLLAGLISFVWRGAKILLRAFPALLAFSLGIVNILSAITPPMHQRLRLLKHYLPLEAIHASTLMVMLMGVALIITSAFLLKGLRNAWIITLVLSLISLIGNITKALDYEEATFAAITILVLLLTFNQYRVKSSRLWLKAGLKTALASIIAIFILAYINFYYINKRHFGVDFTWQQSLYHTFRSFLLIQDYSLHPLTPFGRELIWFLRTLQISIYGFILFCLIKTEKKMALPGDASREKARFLLTQFGNSAVDYFKTYPDKLIFISELHEAFIAYRISRGFAIVLEEPVCAPENKVDVLIEFDRHCRKMGLKPAFYRVDEDSIPWFSQLRKNKLLIGQEAILDVNRFNLEGKEKKSLRNGLNSLQKKGYVFIVNNPPHTGKFMQELKQVSDEWLIGFKKKEQVFSQGMFDEKELGNQVILTAKDQDGSVKAFLNIIPSYADEEITYDLIRKSMDAPGAVMDGLIVELIQYAKMKSKAYLNLGLVPMAGISNPESTAETILKIASEKIRRFQHYRGLRNFKEKYASYWENKYMVYDHDFDLLQLPVALTAVMKPL